MSEDGKLLARSLLVTLLEQLKHARVLVRRDAQDMASPIHSIPSNHMFPLLPFLQYYNSTCKVRSGQPGRFDERVLAPSAAAPKVPNECRVPSFLYLLRGNEWIDVA